LVLQHPERWIEYCELSHSKKAGFFDSNAPMVHRNTIKSHLVGSQAPANLVVDKSIIDVIIGEMLFQDDDANEEIMKEHALSIFEDVLDALEASYDAAGIATARYRIRLKNLAQFFLVTDHLSLGAMF